MEKVTCRVLLVASVALFYAGSVAWADKSSWAEGHDHGRYAPIEYEHQLDFTAFTVSFDSDDDDDKDGYADLWGIPSWVAYEARPTPPGAVDVTSTFSWTTDDDLYRANIAPSTDSYRFADRDTSAKYEYAYYQRGHLMPRNLAERLGREATKETYTMVNVVPQASDFNGGAWSVLESEIEKWAENGSVWVITGPIFIARRPTTWLGEYQRGEMLVAVPHELFKIVVRGDPGSESVLAFIFQNRTYPGEDGCQRPSAKHYLTSVAEVERRTGLLFNIPEDLKLQVATDLWSK